MTSLSLDAHSLIKQNACADSGQLSLASIPTTCGSQFELLGNRSTCLSRKSHLSHICRCALYLKGEKINVHRKLNKDHTRLLMFVFVLHRGRGALLF